MQSQIYFSNLFKTVTTLATSYFVTLNFGHIFDTTNIRLQITTTYFRSLNSVTKLLFSYSEYR